MNVSLDVCSKSLNKREEELCGDTVEIVKTTDADIIILSDGMGSGVKANILSTLTTRILGTMLKNGETIEDCVETIAMTLPICKVRQVPIPHLRSFRFSEMGVPIWWSMIHRPAL